MFHWTPAAVLVAIDAGIAEVISAYNSSYTFAMRATTPLEPHPFTVQSAYGYAMAATLAWLNDLELRLDAERSKTDALLDALVA